MAFIKAGRLFAYIALRYSVSRKSFRKAFGSARLSKTQFTRYILIAMRSTELET